MMKAKILTIAFYFTGLSGNSADVKSFISSADIFLKKYVSNGQVSYSKIKENSIEIEALYRQIGDADLNRLDENSKKAFYINAYNLISIYWVTMNHPIKSPMDVNGFFDKVEHTVATEQLTLNDLEKNKLLAPYKDARLHFVLVCAARSCPPLPSCAFEPNILDKQLTERATLALNDKEWIKVYAVQKKVELSKIFDWYKADFTADGKTLLDWINQYRKIKIPNSYLVSYYEYDWALNAK
ncbi:MAG: DUF547 domain-containing protein [Bacteroidia bacterium]|nr:DUF547 domain-containing protein [Bacteroidia bacterium]